MAWGRIERSDGVTRAGHVVLGVVVCVVSAGNVQVVVGDGAGEPLPVLAGRAVEGDVPMGHLDDAGDDAAQRFDLVGDDHHRPALCGEVEDQYGIRVRPVLIGEDRPTNDASLALVLAGREAMVNAAKHSGCDEINVFVDAEDPTGRIELFVRDRGPGFAVDSIPEDRQGVRQSILGRMERAGGSVEIDTGPGGTEVIFTLPAASN